MYTCIPLQQITDRTVGYLDLYLMHWNINLQVDTPAGQVPQHEHAVKASNGKKKLDVELSDDVTPTWKEMEKLVDAGLTKAIGISNFNINRTKKLLDSKPRIKPVASMPITSLLTVLHRSGTAEELGPE